MRIACFVPALLLGLTRPSAAGEPRFAVPLAIPGVTTPVTVSAGDLDGDARLDLVAGSGGADMTVLIQDGDDRSQWRKSTARVGSSLFFVRAVDLDGDGFAEILAGDTASTGLLIPNAGGTLGDPTRLAQASGARWLTAGDWNRDGLLDCATANFSAQSVSIYAGASPGLLRFLQNYSIAEPHAIEGSDHDGDGDLDLLVGHGDHGLRTFENGGDGRFAIKDLVRGFVPCARYVYAADWDGDGKGDVALTCLRFGPDGNIVGTVLAGVSGGDGSFTRTFEKPTLDIATLAVADLDGDGRRDLAQVSVESSVLSTYLGAGDGSLAIEAQYGVTGQVPAFLTAPDLDGDGRADVVSADAGSSTLTVFWGQAGERFLTGAQVLSGTGGSPSAVADLNEDGVQDLFLTTSQPPAVHAYLRLGHGDVSAPTLSIPTPVEYDDLIVRDLNGDATVDFVGKHSQSGTLRASLLGDAGAVQKELTWSVSDPGAVSIFAVAPLDGDAMLDVVAARLGANDAAVFLNRGDTFVPGPAFATIERRRLIALADLDRDGHADLLAGATGVVAVHFGMGGGSFGEPLVIFQGDPPRAVADLAVAELSGDAHLDVAIAIPGRPEIALVRGRGERAFEPSERLEAPPGVRSISVVDWTREGRDELAFLTNDTLSVFPHRGAAGLGPRVEVMQPPSNAVDHLLADLDGDGALDVTLFASTRTYVFGGVPEGSPASFRRGDADQNNKVEITDAVALLEHLFRSGPAVCGDGGDTDDDGQLGLTDAIVLLRWLFQGGPAPGAPGPLDCGEDPTGDELDACAAACR